jgi:hypothetical protein
MDRLIEVHFLGKTRLCTPLAESMNGLAWQVDVCVQYWCLFSPSGVILLKAVIDR